MATTYQKIASVTVGSGGAAAFDFTSIPNTYTDLQILVSARSTDAVYLRGLYVQFNGSSSTVYSYRQLYGFNTAAGSYTESGQPNTYIGQIPGTSGTASTFGNISLYIPNYAGGNNKSMSTDSVPEINSASNWQNDLVANLWANTNAINRVYIYTTSGSLAQYSTATLYGIKNS